MANRSEFHQKNLEKIFSPKTVAIVGATNDQGTVPYDILNSILKGDFNGPVYPVSPGQKEIIGIKTYKYVLDIEEAVDLAIIVFPSSVVHLALEQCGQKGIKSVIIISAGFREVGEKGIEKEKKLLEIAVRHGISFIGPNCLGVINTDPQIRLNASFAREMPAPGNIGFLSQSGALCTAVLDYAQAKGIGFSKFVSFGNKTDISEIDLMYYLMRDESTKVILMYLEEVRDGRALMEAAKDIIMNSGKPILIIKSGRTQEGASAAASHTGSLAGSDTICSAAFAQAGIIRCDNIEEMFNIAIAFAYQPIPKSSRVAIITNAGGPGVLTTDAVIKEGLKMARFSEGTTAILKKALPAVANIKNPVDVIGDATAERYDSALKAVLQDEDVSGVFVILTPQSMTDIEDIAKGIVEVENPYNKPVYASFMGEADVAVGIHVLQRHQIPHYSLPESMSRSYYATHSFGQLSRNNLDKPEESADLNPAGANEIIQKALDSKETYLQEFQAVKVLSAYGLPVMDGWLAKTEEEAVGKATELGFPLVMKVQSRDIVHKVDVQGVILNIQSEEEAANAYRAIIASARDKRPEAHIQGVYLTRQIPKGEEVILGVKRDPSFGPVIMFGLGGIFVEIFNDVSFRVAPLSRQEALGMVKQVKAYKILSGVRGQEPRDIDSIVEAIVRLSQLAIGHPEISELDINPLIVGKQDQGCFVADVKIMLTSI